MKFPKTPKQIQNITKYCIKTKQNQSYYAKSILKRYVIVLQKIRV